MYAMNSGQVVRLVKICLRLVICYLNVDLHNVLEIDKNFLCDSSINAPYNVLRQIKFLYIDVDVVLRRL